MTQATEWEMGLTIFRRPSERKKGPINDKDFDVLMDKLVKAAFDHGYVIAGVPKPKRDNCPNCGKIVRSPLKDKCGFCGLVL